MKQLTRTGVTLTRTKLVRKDNALMLGTKPALSFIDSAPNPLAKLDKAAKPEQRAEEVQSEVLKGFIARAKAEAVRFAETTRTDYYFCVVFEHGDQANAFLRDVGYPENSSIFIDGNILAKALEIELPPTPFKLKALRPPDKSLNTLVTSIPKRSEIKREPALPAKPKR